MVDDRVLEQLTERFFRYSAISTESIATVNTLPSSPGQLVLAKLLADELKTMGIEDVVCDSTAIVSARLPGNCPGASRVGFVAHLDTAGVGLSPEVRPQVLHFDGQDVCLNKDKNIWLRVDEHPELVAYKNEKIIFSDGTSVLGADDKAAVAVIMTMLQNLCSTGEKHGDIVVVFTPDEEIGLRGAKAIDLERLPVDFAYTIDCCELGEVATQTFNAASAVIKIEGVSAHPMSAKNVMVNPVLVGQDIISRFDPMDTPEHTEGREGYTWFLSANCGPTEGVIHVNIRDHDKEAFENRKKSIQDAVNETKKKFEKARIWCEIEDIYSNIGDLLLHDRKPMDLLLAAVEKCEVDAKLIVMRGGTDGSALSTRGITTPNYFTGAHNFHSKFEFLPLSSFVKSYCVTMALIELARNAVTS